MGAIFLYGNVFPVTQEIEVCFSKEDWISFSQFFATTQSSSVKARIFPEDTAIALFNASDLFLVFVFMYVMDVCL
jgi:hypothetical protein